MTILQVLIESGGKAPLKKVVKRVGVIMGPVLNQFDYKELPSRKDEIRWMNATKWARSVMVHDLGLLRNDSP